MKRLASLALIGPVLLGCAAPADAPPTASAAQARPCPDGVAAGTRCLAGEDGAGAFYWIAVPPRWNGVLVMHAHGGPELGAPRSERTAQDLARWSVWGHAGYAWAGSSYRPGGVGGRSAAEDVERLRRIFGRVVAAPSRTVL